MRIYKTGELFKIVLHTGDYFGQEDILMYPDRVIITYNTFKKLFSVKLRHGSKLVGHAYVSKIHIHSVDTDDMSLTLPSFEADWPVNDIEWSKGECEIL